MSHEPIEPNLDALAGWQLAAVRLANGEARVVITVQHAHGSCVVGVKPDEAEDLAVNLARIAKAAKTGLQIADPSTRVNGKRLI